MERTSKVLPDRADIAIIGAGTAGAAAAALCARAGMKVVCTERRPLDRAGARWVNGVPATDFDDAGFARPTGDELLGEGGPFHLIAGYGPDRITITDHGVLEVDMRLLVDRLQNEARDAGAQLVGGVTVRDYHTGVLVTDRGSMRADLVVDAAGLAGPNLLDNPAVRPGDICTAAQQVRQITDPAGARDFFEKHGIPYGEVCCFTGIAGGYSILNLRCEGDRVGILTGSIAADGHPSGLRILEAFAADRRWIGDTIFGGARAIPIRRPFDRIASDRVAALGDSACQVFPAHGSGIGAGMVAARYLADSLLAGGTPRDYATAWQRAKGGLFASYDLFRRFSQRLTTTDLSAMMTAGLMDPELARAGMAQELPRPSAAQLAQKAPALARHPGLTARLGTIVAKMAVARALYQRYPEDPARLPTWSKRIARVFGDPADIAAGRRAAA